MTNLGFVFFCVFTFLFLLFRPFIFKHRGCFRLFRFFHSSSYKKLQKFNVSNSRSKDPFYVLLIETNYRKTPAMQRGKLEIGDGCVGGDGGREEDEGEEVEMEKFWDLVGILREEVGHRRRKAEKEEDGAKRKKIKEEETKGWVPAFEKGDFTKEIEFVGLPLIFPKPCNNIKKDEEKQDDCKVGLDLKLKL